MVNNSTAARVLVVEDSSTQAQIEKLILESEGFEVEVAANAESGFQRFVDSSFDLVLSDVMMPGMSGYELCQQIKAHSKGKNTPVVLLTALNELNNLVEGLRVGADNFITKPFEASYLIARVNSVLNNRTDSSSPECDPNSGVCHMDKSFIMSLDRRRILDYLVSTFDDYFRTRQRDSERKAAEAKRRADMVEQREAFLTNLARDLRTPIVRATARIDRLLDGSHGRLDPRQTDILAQVRNDNQSILELIPKLFKDYRTTNTPTPLVKAPDLLQTPHKAL